MPNQTRDIQTTDSESFAYIYEQNVTIPLRSSTGIVRCNVYRPKISSGEERAPVLVTYGPYGKDIPYKEYFSISNSVVQLLLTEFIASTHLLSQKSTRNKSPLTQHGKFQIQATGQKTATLLSASTSVV